MAHPAIAFVHELRFSDLPPAVVRQATRCMLDLVGVAAAGSTTRLSRIVRDHAARHFAAGAGATARMLFDGRAVSPLGAALAGGMTIDSFDAHDGHVLTKGHAGVAALPALLALIEVGDEPQGRELLTMLTLGYEVATRAGIALHATACDYHTSGAWNALACAAIGARRLRLAPEATRHALGIAEYHGPRSQMMRCIDHPTMVKDGSGWGAMAGVSAAFLAAGGFTGAPALTLESEAIAELWADLGSRWRTLEQYLKPYPVCRWAQPAVEAALALMRGHGLSAEAVRSIAVTSFREAVRLAAREPATTEEAQYSLPFAVAAALVGGSIGPGEIAGRGLRDPRVLRLSAEMTLGEGDAYNALFPAERWAHVTITLRDGRVLTSAPAVARGSPENPLDETEIVAKYRSLTRPVVGADRSVAIEAGIMGLADAATDAALLIDDLLLPAAADGNFEGW